MDFLARTAQLLPTLLYLTLALFPSRKTFKTRPPQLPSSAQLLYHHLNPLVLICFLPPTKYLGATSTGPEKCLVHLLQSG